MEKKIGKHMQDVWSHKTSGMPKFLIMRLMIKSEKISAKDQQEYWLGVGMLLYLVKHACPDIAKTTRELLKANDGANPAAYCVMRYVLDTKNLVLKIKPTGNSNDPLEIVYFSNIDYIGVPMSRRSIHRFILYVLGVLVSWQCKL